MTCLKSHSWNEPDAEKQTGNPSVYRVKTHTILRQVIEAPQVYTDKEQRVEQSWEASGPTVVVVVGILGLALLTVGGRAWIRFHGTPVSLSCNSLSHFSLGKPTSAHDNFSSLSQ